MPRKKSRIPGVFVEDVADTSLGPKKKVCFNVGGRWYFRMVDPNWKAPGRLSKRGKGLGIKGGSDLRMEGLEG